MRHIAAIAAAFFLLSGCSTVIKGTSDTININSLERGTVILVDGARRGLDSAIVNVKKGKTYAIKAEKDGCESVTATTTETFDPTSLLGIFIDFGIFTIPTDLISGAAWKAEPNTYTVTPICKGKA